MNLSFDVAILMRPQPSSNPVWYQFIFTVTWVFACSVSVKATDSQDGCQWTLSHYQQIKRNKTLMPGCYSKQQCNSLKLDVQQFNSLHINCKYTWCFYPFGSCSRHFLTLCKTDRNDRAAHFVVTYFLTLHIIWMTKYHKLSWHLANLHARAHALYIIMSPCKFERPTVLAEWP